MQSPNLSEAIMILAECARIKVELATNERESQREVSKIREHRILSRIVLK
ncbi:MAG: hypothetical protein WCD72_03905 [Dehalococcoidia bacterium]